jgi:hypothetical protein
MKQYKLFFTLSLVLQFYVAIADVFTTTNKNIRIEVIDYRDCLDDILFWIHSAKDTPVFAQKLINNGIYPISVTIYNDSNQPIKIVKNAIGGLSTAQDDQVVQLYQSSIGSQVIKKAAVGAVVGIGVMKTLDLNEAFFTWRLSLQDSLYAKIEYLFFATGGLGAALMQWPSITTINALITQAFKSQMLPEESLIASGCSVSFVLFANHSPSGHTLKVPILNEQDAQVVSFLCSFGSIVAQ